MPPGRGPGLSCRGSSEVVHAGVVGGRILVPMPDDVAARGGDDFDAHAPRDGDAALAGLLTIKDVGDACGLPQPVVAQLVPRTWTAAGWMYTPGQLRYAVSLAESMRKRRGRPPRPRLKLVDGQG